MRKKTEVETSAESFSESEENAAAVAVTRCSQTWAMLIKRVYEVDPLSCPQCGGQMKVVALCEVFYYVKWRSLFSRISLADWYLL